MKCPFCGGEYTETGLALHITRIHNKPTYAWALATSIRLGHQEKAQDINGMLREMKTLGK